jgi:hypothetical protein
MSKARLNIVERESIIKSGLHPSLTEYFISLIESNRERIQVLTQRMETLDAMNPLD